MVTHGSIVNNKEGGYECEFVEKPPEALQSSCPVCYKVSCKRKNISIVGRDSDSVHFL